MFTDVDDNDESIPHPSDINSSGQSIYDLIAMEDARYMRRIAEIRNMEHENRAIHCQNMDRIVASFGIDTNYKHSLAPKSQRLSAKEKKEIKERVKEWANTSKASGCKSHKKK